MIRTSTRQIVRGVACTFIGFAFGSIRPCLGERENGETSVLPLSTAYVPVPGETTGKMFYTTVEWEEHEYQAQEGTTVLMEVIVDAGTDPSVRAKALERLSGLRNRDTTPQLLSLYDDLREAEEKAWVLRCLTSSEDPRGLPLFARVLEQEADDTVRMVAAFSLAQWNVRRGVEEFVGLLDSGAPVRQTGRMKYDLHTLINVFATENRRRSWGFPFEEVAKSIGQRTDLADEQKASLLASEIKKWFSENKDRFPDWKLGDPLPPAPKLPPTPPGPQTMLSLSVAMRTPSIVWTTSEEKKQEVIWEDKHYPAAEGVNVLMKVVSEGGDGNDRFRAIQRLGRIGCQVRNTDRIPELMDVYGRLTDRSQRVALLFCLAESKDPRALPLFWETLDTPREDYLRLPAAYGLALWNIRRGVRELVELVSVKQNESPVLYPGIIGDEAARLLSRLNYRKSWCAPQAPLQAVAEARTEFHDETLDSCHTELEKWFTENEHRFPDWKGGDPLPGTPQECDEQAQ